MKRITHNTPINAELWIRLDKRLDTKSKAIESLSVINGKLPEYGELPDDHWFSIHIGLDLHMSEVKLDFIKRYNKMLDAVYNLLSDEDKKIVDEYVQASINKSMAELYDSLSDDDFGDGVYMFDGMYLQPDGTIEHD